MPGFAGQGSRDFAFTAGSVHGYRWWCLRAPDLRADPLTADKHWPESLLCGQMSCRWNPGINTAACLYHSEHAPPVEFDESLRKVCGCGFYAYWAPPEVPHFYENGIWLLGVIEGFGRTLIGSEGFRSQHAKIVALHLASEFSLAMQGRSEWARVFSQPGLHHPPHGRPLSAQGPGPVSSREMAEATDRMLTWQSVIEDRLERTYPEARIITVRRALLVMYPPYRDRENV